MKRLALRALAACLEREAFKGPSDYRTEITMSANGELVTSGYLRGDEGLFPDTRRALERVQERIDQYPFAFQDDLSDALDEVDAISRTRFQQSVDEQKTEISRLAKRLRKIASSAGDNGDEKEPSGEPISVAAESGTVDGNTVDDEARSNETAPDEQPDSEKLNGHTDAKPPETEQPSSDQTPKEAGDPKRVRTPKRSTERGEARTKLIAALTKHHDYSGGSCLKLDPIGARALARAAKVSPSSACALFRAKFGSHLQYRKTCTDPHKLAISLKALNNEFSPIDLYGLRPPGAADSADE